MADPVQDAIDKAMAEGDASPAQPITTLDRLIMTTLFDTQPKRRAEYLKQKGWELDPKDDNNIRPIGTSGPYDSQIDPGGFLNFKQYYNPKTGGWKPGTAEFTKDAGEGIMDIVQGAIIEGGGDTAGLIGALGAGAATGGAGVGPGFLVGRAAGRAGTYEFIEAFKDKLGNYFTDNDIPPDQKLRAMQAGIQSVAPEIVGAAAKGGLKVAAKAAGKTFDMASSGFKKLLNIGGGNVDPEAIKALIKNPEKFANEEYLKNATSQINDTINTIYGKELGEARPKNFFELGKASPLVQKMDALESAKRTEVAKLTGRKEADTTLEELISPLQEMVYSIDGNPNKSINDKATAKYLKTKIADLTKFGVKAEGQQPNMSTKLPFTTMDQVIGKFQKDIYNKSGERNEWADAVEGVVGRLNSQLKTKADEVYVRDLGFPSVDVAKKNGLHGLSPYTMANAEQSKIFDYTNNVILPNLDTNRVTRTIFSGTPKGTSADKIALDTGAAVQHLDELLGTNIYGDLQTGQLQNNLYQAMQKSRLPRGSGGLLTGAATGAALGGAAGAPIGMAGPGAIAGGVAGALASQPSVGLKAIGNLEGAKLAAQNVAQEVGPLVGTNPAGLAEKVGINLPSLEASRQIPLPQSKVEEEDPVQRAIREALGE
jgi:hypothetical protein